MDKEEDEKDSQALYEERIGGYRAELQEIKLQTLMLPQRRLDNDVHNDNLTI